ncbi:MAG: phosphopantothenoylcysteine decarboxylase [Phycisphaerae bacterium]|nr:phosphopantothenoylcysteine decarboxylase [Phycisphaerae bacterium]
MSAPLSFLVTAGPTHEAIDAVRYIANRSSGRMGVAIANEAASRGHPTTLLLGPVAIEPPSCVRCLRFTSAADLERLLAIEASLADVVVMAAAVADFRPAAAAPTTKIERGAGLSITLEPVPDLIRGVASRRRAGQRLVGFALEEPAKLDERARRKLSTKDLDAVVANPLATMDSPSIAAQVYLRDGRVLVPPTAGPAEATALPKVAFAAWLVDLIERLPTRDSAPGGR